MSTCIKILSFAKGIQPPLRPKTYRNALVIFVIN